MKPILLLVCLVLAACGHDADRDNPLDPTRTPAVEVTVTVDADVDVARLTWTPYAGEEPFGAYLVLRNVVRTTDVDTLARIEAPTDTSYPDGSLAPATAYEYRVAVVNAAGYAVTSPSVSFGGFPERPVAMAGVAADAAAATLAVSWTRYRGAGFEGYDLRRQRAGTGVDSVVAQLDGVADTTFVDGTPLHGVDYSYRVVVRAAGRQLASSAIEASLRLPPVSITDLRLDAATASAQLTWRGYAGPGFAAYRVERDALGTSEVLATIDDRADTSLADAGLLGAVDYAYRVVVLTERGEAIDGPPTSGAIHGLTDVWPLPMDPAGAVWLEGEPQGGVRAVIAEPGRIQLLRFRADGSLHDQDDLLVIPQGKSLNPQKVRPAAVTGPSTPDGGTALLYKVEPIGISVAQRFDAEGELSKEVFEPFAEQTLPSGSERRQARGVITLRSGVPDTRVRYDDIRVLVDDETRYEQDVERGMDDWTLTSSTGGIVSGNSVSVDIGGGVAEFYESEHSSPDFFLGEKIDLSWEAFRMEADVTIVDAGVAGIGIGDGRGAILSLKLDSYEQQLVLRWLYVPPDDSSLERVNEVYTIPFPVVAGVTYRLSLGGPDGTPVATVEAPLYWYGAAEAAEDLSAAFVEDVLAITAGTQPLSLAPDGSQITYAPLDAAPAGMRVWDVANGQEMGMCFPLAQRVSVIGTGISRTGRVTFAGGPFGTNLEAAGQGPGELLFPMSLDGAPDGRIYVLDAANSRIQAFTPDLEYITHWGRSGTDPGEFDFTSESGAVHLGGSVAVDGEGRIYVADVGNQRIQVFAP